MATPLLWKAYQLNEMIFTRHMYSHVISMDISKEQYVYERNWRKLLPFYISFSTVFAQLLFSTFIVLEYIFNRSGALPLPMVLFSVDVGCLALLVIGTNLVLLRQGEELMTVCANKFYEFDRKLGNDHRVKGYVLKLSSKKLIAKEIKRILRRDKNADIMGLLMHGVIVILFVVGIIFALAAVFTQLDPAHYVIQKYFPGKSLLGKILSIGFRFLIAQWAVMEATRSLTILLLPAVSGFYMLTLCLKRVSALPPDYRALGIYAELRVLLQIGLPGIRNVAGLLMGMGFNLGVIGTWAIIVGWKAFPAVLYAILVLITVVIYTVIQQTLPKICLCYQYSDKLIQIGWTKRAHLHCKIAVSGFEYAARRFQYTLWKSHVRAQRPVAFYYGSAAFDQDTVTHFYENIVDNAINLVLLT